jgi:hypothetical protein
MDFEFDAKAIDSDEGPHGNILYRVGFLHQEDEVPIVTRLNSTTGILKVLVEGKYLNSKSRLPLMFQLIAYNDDKPQLADIILIIIKALDKEFKPVYFQFATYQFDLIENNPSTNQKNKIKILDENINKTEINLVVDDPLSLLANKPTFQELNADMVDSSFERILLFKFKDDVDFDDFYARNQHSNIYTIIIKAIAKIEKNEIETEVKIIVKLIDENDSKPEIILNDNSIRK